MAWENPKEREAEKARREAEADAFLAAKRELLRALKPLPLDKIMATAVTYEAQLAVAEFEEPTRPIQIAGHTASGAMGKRLTLAALKGALAACETRIKELTKEEA